MGSAEAEDDAVLGRAIKRARARLIPFLVLMYVIAFIDRANVGFAKQALQADTGIGDSSFAFGAGIFFFGYALFEVPSNLILYRVGARRWLGRIMVSWGIVAAALALTQGATSFYALRFLLGLAEAGFFPGIVFYISKWFPARARAGSMGQFYFGLPLALVIGGPLSGILLDAPAPGGWHSWQLMFAIEGGLASIVGTAAFFCLTDRPADARWLSLAERGALIRAVAAEDVTARAHGPESFRAAVADRRVIAFCLIYFTVQMSVYGVTFSLPARIAELTGGRLGMRVGLLTAIPWLVAIAATWSVTRIADRVGKRRQLAAAMLALAAAGMAASAFASSAPTALFAFSAAAAGFVAVQPLYWTMPTGYLSGVAAAGAIGMINAIGNLGGFLAPNLKAWAEAATGAPWAGMAILALVALAGSAALLALDDNKTGAIE